MGGAASAFCSGSVCGKASAPPIAEHDIFDDSSACDPAGAVFQDTLEDLGEVDRLLLTFSSSSNIAVVRWLFVLGANAEACDSNGTTCLHAACRSGSLSVVREHISRGLALDATDASGWTALHVACFMGRRKVALELMLSGAEPHLRNLKGFTPRSLCSDEWLRSAITACAEHRVRNGSLGPWQFEREKEVREDVQIATRLHFEPFFVPRAPVLQKISTGPLVGIGVEIFTQRPGQGLAFLVATGCVRDYPVELCTFLAEHKLKTQVGEFLGEDFSLSQTLRLEFLNSVRLLGTGVVSGLTKVFESFQIPSDLHKLNRLVEGAAQIWWRQHEQAKEIQTHQFAGEGLGGEDGPEATGIVLMELLPDYDALHQLMLSTIFLHWSLYAPLPPQRRITKTQWLELNAGIGEASGGDLSSHPTCMSAGVHQVLCRVYQTVNKTFTPQLQLWLHRLPGVCGRSATSEPPIREVTIDPQADDVNTADGWGLLVGGCSLPSPAGASFKDVVTYRHIRSILSEATSTTAALVSPVTSRGSRTGPEQPLAEVHSRTGSRACGGTLGSSCGVAPILEGWPAVTSPGSRGDQVWLSMRHGLLFLAPKPTGWAPYAFMHLRDVVVQDFDRSALTVSLAMKAEVDPPPSSPPAAARKQPRAVSSTRVHVLRAPPSERSDCPPQLQLIFLLPDGRWQLLDVPMLQLQLLDAEHMDRWRRELEAQCQIAGRCTSLPDTGGSADRQPMDGERTV